MRLSYRARIGIIVVLIVVFFLALNLTPFGKEVKNFFYSVSSPIQKVFWGAGSRVAEFFQTIAEIKELKQENQELKLKIQELLAENVTLKELKEENDILREALNIGLEKEFRLVISQVIGISTDINPDFIFIDKGAKDGIRKYLPVITQQKTLVGRISEVHNNFSEVMLITNKEITFVAKISETEIYGNVKGRGNFQLFLENIPRDEEIQEGNLIVTTPLGGVFPGGLLVGEIKEIKKSDVKPFQEAEILPHFNIKEIKHLFIITNFQSIQ